MKFRNLIMVLMLLLLTNVCSASQLVRISDYGSDGFFYRYNEIAQNMGKSHVSIVSIPKIQYDATNDTYDTYVGVIGSNGHNITISLFANKEGYVSKIMLGGEATDTIAMNNVGDILAVLLTTMDVNKGELANFYDEWQDIELTDMRIWCSSAERFILINRGINQEYNTFAATFTAAV